MIRIFLSQPEFDHCFQADQPPVRTTVGDTLTRLKGLISPQDTYREDLAGPNTKLFGERTMANPNLGATLIRYARTGCMGGNSIERQDDAMDAWLCARGLEADEEITELAKGTRVNEGLESVLRRAEAGERILVIAARPDRISRDAVALAEFVRRAAACGLDLQFVRG